MLKPALALIAASALTLPAAAFAANVEIDAAGPVVELSVYESIDVAPDTATIGAGVTTEARPRPRLCGRIRRRCRQ